MCSVASTTFAIASGVNAGRRPGRGASFTRPDQPGLLKAIAPQIDRRPTDAELLRDRVDRRAVRRRQDDQRARDDPLRRLPTADQRFQIRALRRTERQRLGRFPHAAQDSAVRREL